MKLVATLLFVVVGSALGAADARAQSVLVNEFLASNALTNADPDFERFEDWIELHNPTAEDVELSGYFLTDNLSRRDKWRVPDGAIIPAGGYLLVWADGRDTGSPATTALHTNSSLSATREAVGLFTPTRAVVDTVSYGQQATDVSQGRVPGTGAWAFFGTPTPGAANTTAPGGSVARPPTVSLESGFYPTEQTLTLASPEPDAVVRYTVDGSEPGPTSTAYTGPIALTGTTAIRAASFAPDRAPSGLYLIVMEAVGFRATQRMVVAR